MPAGALNGLAQCLLRLTCPGIPDLYQGREDWDFSLVDPDNRRPVDFARHAAALAAPTPFPELLEHWRDGRIKQTLIARVLGLRRMQPGLFRDGDYLPLEVSGEHAERVLAFARRSRHGCLLVVVPRLACALLGHATQPQVPAEAWGDTCLLPPPSLRMHHSGLFSTMPLPSDGHLSLSGSARRLSRQPALPPRPGGDPMSADENAYESSPTRSGNPRAAQTARPNATGPWPGNWPKRKRRGGTEEDPRSGQGRQGNPGPAASAGRQAAQAEGHVPARPASENRRRPSRAAAASPKRANEESSA